MMHVSRLSLENFRSYREARLEAGPGMVVVTGDNGAGKTNLLEALSLLAPGRGLRSAALREMARDDGDGGFAVAARLPGLDIGIGTLPASPDRRLVRVNGLAAAANSLPEHVSFLWLTPAMDRLFAEPASARRRFLDRLVLALDPAHAAHSARYEAAMRARNKLLAGEGMPDAAWMAAVEARMAEHGARIVEARSAAVRALQEAISAEPESPFPRAVLALEGGEEKDLAERLAAGRLRDAESGRTLAGPHRTDLVVTHEGKARPASASSTGEQKALLVGIVLAHARLVEDKSGRRPILLLDEIAAHLDARRRGVLLARLAADGGQVWMTGTDRHLFDSAPGTPTFLSVEDGRVRAA